jgi:hypothetical protein
MSKRSTAIVVVVCLVAAATVGAVVFGNSWPVASPAPAKKPALSLKAPAAKVEVGEPVRLTGSLENAGSADDQTVVLQRKRGGRWVDLEETRQKDGKYGFVRVFGHPMVRSFRTVAEHDGKRLISTPRSVKITGSQPAGRELSPDLGAKKLTDCSRSEQPCLRIVTTAGRRLLTFPMITVNVGDGPIEIHGYRSTRTSSDWKGTQTTYYSSGDKQSLPFPGVVFYWSGDGHDHWHIKDFDTYDVLDARGKAVRVGEKHGFCFEDNTTYRDWPNNPAHPNVPAAEVYKHEWSCGVNAPNATSIVHGLSVGWGDTYPTTLPDQNIDITRLKDGVYTVRVIVDGQQLIKEDNENNNIASVRFTLKGNKIEVDESTATGL